MARVSVAAAFIVAMLTLSACGGSRAAPLSPRDYVVPAKRMAGAGALAVRVPRGFHRYRLSDGLGVGITDYRPKTALMSDFAKWSQLSSNGPPAKKVVLILSLWETIGFGEPSNLHLPLSLDQPWHQEHLRNGARGYRWGYLSFDKQQYNVLFWSGPAAPPHDRDAILNALTSIRPAP